MARTHKAELARRQMDLFSGIEAAGGLPKGSVRLLGLELGEHEMTFSEWEGLGRIIGTARRWSAFALGDWLNFGEAMFGEESAQAVEGVPADRYDVARRVTGLEQGTLRNYASVCGRVALSRRRVELDFGHHDAVSALEADEQDQWLQRAVDESMTREDLRRAIRGADGDDGGDGPLPLQGEVILSRADRAEQILSGIWHQAQPLGDGRVAIPDELYSQVGALIGVE